MGATQQRAKRGKGLVKHASVTYASVRLPEFQDVETVDAVDQVDQAAIVETDVV